jgi:hypothetical protein
MTDEELQTMIANACKAAGIEYSHAGGYRVIGIGATGMKVMEKFNPADDDGDSRMLQVACKIALHFEVIGGEWCAEAYSQPDDDDSSFCTIERLQDDAKKAARMAVLRCAGMTGEAME